MNINIFKATSTDTLLIATNNPLEILLLKDFKLEKVAQFDESDPARSGWISDRQWPQVKDLISCQRYACIFNGEIEVDLPAPFGFFQLESQTVVPSYWGIMTKAGQLGAGCSAFFVRFHDEVPHGFHQHPKHGEIVFVVSGQIKQTIGYETRHLKAGDCAVIPIGERHRAEPLVADTQVFVVLFGDGTDYLSVELE